MTPHPSSLIPHPSSLIPHPSKRSAAERLRAYYTAKDNGELPVTVDRLWREYIEAVEREMAGQEKAA